MAKVRLVLQFACVAKKSRENNEEKDPCKGHGKRWNWATFNLHLRCILYNGSFVCRSRTAQSNRLSAIYVSSDFRKFSVFCRCCSSSWCLSTQLFPLFLCHCGYLFYFIFLRLFLLLFCVGYVVDNLILSSHPISLPSSNLDIRFSLRCLPNFPFDVILVFALLFVRLTLLLWRFFMLWPFPFMHPIHIPNRIIHQLFHVVTLP